jgi:ATP-binding cassette, subfamily B, bacterial
MQLGTARQTLKHYWQEVKHYPAFWIPILILMPLGVFLINYAQPYIVAQAIDILSTKTVSTDQIWDVFGTWIILFALSAIVGELIVWRLMVWLIWSLEKRVAFALYQKSFTQLSNQSAQFHANQFGGSLVSQTNKFVSSYMQLANTFTFNVMPLASSLAFTFIILTPLVPLFALGLAILCLIFMAIAIFSFRRVRELGEAESEANNKLSGLIADTITNILAVKSFGREKAEGLEFGTANKKAQDASGQVLRAVIVRDISFGGVLVVGSIFMFLILVSGPALFGVSIGTLVLISTYSFSIFGRLWNFNAILRDINRAFGNAAPMTAVFDTAIDVKDVKDPQPVSIDKGEIRFANVCYAHADAKDEALFKNFDLKIKPGEKVGLVGHSGSGKTTLTKLLLRFVDIDEGTIKIDGQDVSRIAQADLRNHIAYVPQEPLLFHRTIEENIAYGKSGASYEEIIEAARKAHALEFVEKLPEGIHTTVGERGVKLSGGQRQRIAIARAILKDAPILLLDEATSALDSESEQLIQKALGELMKNRTAIVIAHRLSTIQKMDRIIVLENGHIVEQGPHSALLKQKGVYASLWAHQSGGMMEE